jgi:hypothetical protein
MIFYLNFFLKNYLCILKTSVSLCGRVVFWKVQLAMLKQYRVVLLQTYGLACKKA